MIDLFGLKKNSSEDSPTEESSAPPAEPPSETPRGSHRLWAFLLVLDSVFVIVFGGAVAAKVYQYWKAPAPPSAAARRRPGKEPIKPPEPPAAKPQEPAPSAPTPAAKEPEPPKTPEPEKPAAKPEPKAVRHSDSPRAPKPSLVTEAPKPRKAPELAEASTSAAKSTLPAPGRPRARPVEFTLRIADAKSAQLVGSFIVRGGRKDMVKKSDGTWSLTLYLHPGQYRYFFSVDKKKLLDPENPNSARGASLLTVQ